MRTRKASVRSALLRLNGDGSKRIVIVNRVMRPYMDDGGILTMGLLDFLLGQDGLDHV